MENSYKNVYSGNDIPIENHLNFIRLFLALLVVFAHLAELSQENIFRWTRYLPNSYTAINAFFILSGFLVFRSYERSKNLKDFFRRRFLRIYPAYFIVILFAIVLGAFLTTLNPVEYFSDKETFRYFGFNLLFMNFVQPTLPGLFEHNFVHAVNGSLWTIKIEVMFYLIVPLIVFTAKTINRELFFLFLYLLSILYIYTALYMNTESSDLLYHRFSKQLPGQLMYFIMGAYCYYNFSKISKIPLWIILPSLLIYIIALRYNLYFLYPVSLAGIIIPLAFTKFFHSPGFIVKNDPSYSLYLFHFPVIQALCDQTLFKKNPLIAFGIFMILIVLISYSSWNLIEKKFIAKK